MKNKKIIYGLDCSLNHIGFVGVSLRSKKIFKYKSIRSINLDFINRFEKQKFMVNATIKEIPINSQIVVEGYAYGKNSNKMYDFIEMMSLLYHSLIKKKCAFWIVPPAITRHFVIGNTRLSKNLSEEERLKREKLKKETKSLIVKYYENRNKAIILTIGQNTYTYYSNDLLKENKVYFEDIADAYITVIYFLEKKYWKNNVVYLKS